VVECAFEIHSIAKLAGKRSDTWKEFIETHIGIRDSYARKLREIATLFKIIHSSKLPFA